MKRGNKFLSILTRYLILILVGILGLGVFYFVFTPITIYPVYFLFNIFFHTVLSGNILFVKQFPIEVVGACVAGSAYYLFFILNLSTPNIKLKQRLNMLGFSFILFLVINILRIFFLGLLFIAGSSWFNFTHKVFWYLISVVFVIGIWFLQVKLFKIKDMPFYSDLKEIYSASIFKKY